MPLETTLGVIKELYFGDKSRMPGKCYSNISRRARLAFSAKFCSQPIFQACKRAFEREDNKFTDEQKRLLSKFILEGKFNGLNLRTKHDTGSLHYCYEEMEKQCEIFRQKLQVCKNKLGC